METTFTPEYLLGRVATLEADVQFYRNQVDFLQGLQNNNVSVIEAAREWTLEQLESGNFDNETAQELANILQFELNKEFDVTIQIEYNFTVKAGSNSEVQEIIDALDIPRIDVPESDEVYIYGELVDSNFTEV